MSGRWPESGGWIGRNPLISGRGSRDPALEACVNDHPNFPQADHLKIPLSSGCLSPVSSSSPGLWDLWAAPLLAPSKELWETPLLAFSIAPSGSIGHVLLFRGWGAAPGSPAPYTARYASADPPCASP